MLNIGGWEVLIIFLVALIVLGPERLPDAAKQVGKVFNEFRRMSAGFQRELNEALKDPVTKSGLLDSNVTVDADVPTDPFASKQTTFKPVSPVVDWAKVGEDRTPAEPNGDEPTDTAETTEAADSVEPGVPVEETTQAAGPTPDPPIESDR